MKIRRGTSDDIPSCVDIVIAAEMFTVDDVGVVDALLGQHLQNDADPAIFLVAEDGSNVLAVAYAEPAPAADRVWYLTMIGVHPATQRGGVGGALLGAVEAELVERGQRLLLVETSALPQYSGARSFYRRGGYDEEARVRDFHEDGDDMVLFRKRLGADRDGHAVTSPVDRG